MKAKAMEEEKKRKAEVNAPHCSLKKQRESAIVGKNRTFIAS